MSNTWKSVEFQSFIEDFGGKTVVNFAPSILYSKKDKEHEAFKALVLFFVGSGFIAIYISVAILLVEIYFNLPLFVITLIILSLFNSFFIILFLKSNISINLLEMWVEIHNANNIDKYFCITYYPIFSGKCHPNKAKNIIYKLYQEQYVKDKLDITQIEVYFKLNKEDNSLLPIGYYFQYGEGTPFDNEDIDRYNWQFFPYNKTSNENYIAIANWDHQFEWREDLALDFDKLHEYAPWVVLRWNDTNLKTLEENNKEALNWEVRNISSTPKLKPWNQDFALTSFEETYVYRDFKVIDEAIEKVLGKNETPKSIKDIKKNIIDFEEYFRNLRECRI